MKKVLILQNSIPHYRIPLYNELANTYKITVLHSGDPSGLDKNNYEEKIVTKKKIGPFYLQSAIFEEISKNHYDVVIVMFDIRWLFNITLSTLRRNFKLIYWGHRYSKNPIANKIRDFFLKRSDAILQYSDVETEQLLALGIKKEKIFVAHNTMHVDNHFDSSSNNKNSLIFVGRAQKRKKVSVFLKAFSEVKTMIPKNFYITIVGDGKENIKLKDLAKQLGIEKHVNFTGNVTNPNELKELYQNAIAYVSPGPVGLAVLHSFAYGVPVITLKKGKHGPEFSNLEHNINSIICNSYDELKNAIINITTNKDTAQNLGKNAYLKYSTSRTIQVMTHGFHNAINY